MDRRSRMRSKHQLLLVESYEELHSRKEKRWLTISYLCVLAVLPVVLCCLFLAIFLNGLKGNDVATSEAQTLADIPVPVVSVSVPAPSVDPGHSGGSVVVKHNRPSQNLRRVDRSGRGICASQVCRFVAQWLRSKIDTTKDPCEDFHSYVCTTHKGRSQLGHIEDTIEEENLKLLNMKVPRTNQLSWQKAAALYQSCMYFWKTNKSETQYLARWMTSLNLDFNDETRLSGVNPFDMIVRCSLDLGVPAVLRFELPETGFRNGKRLMEFQINLKQENWLMVRGKFLDSYNRDYYAEILRWYGVKSGRDIQLASKILEYEKILASTIERAGLKSPFYVTFGNVYKSTTPYVTKEQWVNAITAYTNNTYTAEDEFMVQPSAVYVLVESLKSTSVGVNGLRYLVAWNVFTQLVNYTDPFELVRYRYPTDVCYEHIRKVMRLAVSGPYLLKVLEPAMVEEVKTMLVNIRNVFRQEFESSTWVTGQDRINAIAKLDKMADYVGSPGNRLERDSLERIYKSYPDVPTDLLFPSWIAALSQKTHYLWIDQKNWLYDETEVNAFFAVFQNSIIIPSAIIARPLYHHKGPPALNYGSLGTILGHEMMHAFDVVGMLVDHKLHARRWGSSEFQREYTKRGLCLRRSHRTALRQRARDKLEHVKDSENLCDVVGVRNAYYAFKSLPYRKQRLTLIGINASAERLFFLGQCATWCSEYDNIAARYAPYASRCNVPLMNMPEFAEAYGCAPGTRMNPTEKCAIWQ